MHDAWFDEGNNNHPNLPMSAVQLEVWNRHHLQYPYLIEMAIMNCRSPCILPRKEDMISDIVSSPLIPLAMVCPRGRYPLSIHSHLAPFYAISRNTMHGLKFCDIWQVRVAIGNHKLCNLLSHIVC